MRCIKGTTFFASYQILTIFYNLIGENITNIDKSNMILLDDATFPIYKLFPYK